MIPLNSIHSNVCKLLLDNTMSVPGTPSHHESDSSRIIELFPQKPSSVTLHNSSSPTKHNKDFISYTLNKKKLINCKTILKQKFKLFLYLLKKTNNIYIISRSSLDIIYQLQYVSNILNLNLIYLLKSCVRKLQSVNFKSGGLSSLVNSKCLCISNICRKKPIKSKIKNQKNVSRIYFSVKLKQPQSVLKQFLNISSTGIIIRSKSRNNNTKNVDQTDENNQKSKVVDPKLVSSITVCQSIIQDSNLLLSILSFLDARDIIRFKIATSNCEFKTSIETEGWNLWNAEDLHVQNMCPSMFLNRNLDFFNKISQYKKDNFTGIEHVVLDRWWNNLSGKDDNALMKILAQSPLKTISVEPGFYDCTCQSCFLSKRLIQGKTKLSQKSLMNLESSPRTEVSSRFSLSLSTRNQETTDILGSNDLNTQLSMSNSNSNLQISDNITGDSVVEVDYNLLSINTENQVCEYEELNNLIESNNTNLNGESSMDNENERRPTHQLAEVRTDNINQGETDEASLTEVNEIGNNLNTLNKHVEFIPHPIDQTQDSLALFVAKRHAIARFFWLLRLLLIVRDTVEIVKFNGPPEYLQTMCDHISSIPELPINFKILDTPYVFKYLKEMQFGVAIDCRYVVPLLDFCKFKSLTTVRVIGLTINYETLKPQFGVQPTMMFSPQQVFMPSSDESVSKWLPAVYNGPIDEHFRLQGQGVYVSREYHYEGSFKNGRNHGWGKMISKCGEIYEGFWNEGRRCGPGVVTQLFGKRLEGNWVCDSMHGRGTMITRRGRKYEGDWNNGSLDGWGVISENGKLQAICQFYNGLPCGWMRCRSSYYCSTHIKLLIYPPVTRVASFSSNYLVNSPIKPLKSRIVIGSTAVKYEDNNDSPINTNNQSFISPYEKQLNSDNILPESVFNKINKHCVISNLKFEMATLKSLDQTNDTLKAKDFKGSTKKFSTSKDEKISVLEQLNTSEWMDIWTFSYTSEDIHAKAFHKLDPPQKVEDLFVLNPKRLLQQPGLQTNFNKANQLIIPQIPQWIEEIVSQLSI